MKLIQSQLGLEGCQRIALNAVEDERGWFMKTFHAEAFRAAGLESHFPESFVSASRKGVLRGMHLQLPPHQHAKLVRCLGGQVLDVLLDLRCTSASFGQSCSTTLDGARPEWIYIPPGVAHGFLALTDGALMEYRTSSVHAPSHDVGIHWDSFGFVWPITAPVTSKRDAIHPALAEFDSPF
jgi:dTDP-4-dehydrorhamnose 3,5-epimerase